MGKRNALKRAEAQFGDLHQIIPALVNEGGQKHAADKLGVTQGTISRWLSVNGYVVRWQYWHPDGRPATRLDDDPGQMSGSIVGNPATLSARE